MESTMKEYQTLKASEPHLHTRDAARRLGLSEAELVAALPGSQRLGRRFAAALRAMPTAGRVKTMTRNESVVLERWGVFEEVEADDDAAMGQVVGADIDLRLFFHHWAVGFYVVESGVRGERHSMQWFDRQGESIHKVYAESGSSIEAFRRIAADVPDDGEATFVPASAPRAAVVDELAPEDLARFRADWDSMQNTHEFFGLLRRHRLSRLRALELAGDGRAREVAPQALGEVLRGVASDAEPLMIFVGNRGAIQIHTGPVEKVVESGGYLNVLDPGFNLHVRDGAVARAFVVRKPTVDGIVTSLELYDDRAENVALVFSKRKPGQVEAERWRERLAALTQRGEAS